MPIKRNTIGGCLISTNISSDLTNRPKILQNIPNTAVNVRNSKWHEDDLDNFSASILEAA
jgi:hypothetical protein